MNPTYFSISVAACFLILGTSVLSEVVPFQICSDEVNNCTIDEVRVTPCKEAAQNKPCKVKKGRPSSIAVDFTPGFDADKMTGTAYWKNNIADLPFIGMDTNACNYTTCPIVKDVKTTYDFRLDVSRKFPSSTYEIKWKLVGGDHQCCFLLKISLVK